MLLSSKFLKLLFVQVQRTRRHRCLSNFNEVPVGVSHVAPQFRCMNFGLSDEFRATRRPKLVAPPDVTHAKIQKDAKYIWIAWRRSSDFRLVVGRAAADVDREPDVAEPEKRWLPLAQDFGAQDVAVEGD